MKRFNCFLIAFLFLCCLTAISQKKVSLPGKAASLPASKPGKNIFTIKGEVLDSVTHQPLVSATVYVKNTKDSTITSLTLTDNKGDFELKDIPNDKELLFSIFYTGYAPYQKELKDVKSNILDFGTIYLSIASHTLGEVTIKGATPPIAIIGDTIQFNASSFKTRPNSVLADLLKKLPGVEVDKNGNVTAMGVKVDRIEVNGKRFFGNDPKIALQNLPSAIVDKVQITDTKTTEEEMTGQPSNGQAKTINITLKKGLDHGLFGRAYAGYGTGKHYDASMLLNYFEGQRQISLLGATNNVDKTGFTMNEISSMMNPNGHTGTPGYNTGNGGMNVGGIAFGPSQAGLNTTTTAGVNYIL